MEPTELCNLGKKYYVDKSPYFGGHTYTPYYHQILSERRNDIKLLLEIGIGNIPLMAPLTSNLYKPGGSLKMWREYLKNATIIGCDILESVLFKDDRIITFKTDQSNVESLNNLIRNIQNTPNIEKYADVILDDGSHVESHMVISFKELWKFVKIGGLYIIEDIHLYFINRIINLNKEFRFIDAECIYIHKGKFIQDNFVVFKKIEIL